MTSALNVLKSVKKGEMFQLQEWKHDGGDSKSWCNFDKKIELEKKPTWSCKLFKCLCHVSCSCNDHYPARANFDKLWH